MPSSSLLFEQQTTPVKLADSLEANTGNLRYGLSQSSSSSGIPPFQPFSEPPTPAPQTHSLHTLFPNTSPSQPQSIYSSPLPRRVEMARVPQMDWRLTQQPLSQQPLALQADWRFASEKSAFNFNLNQIGHNESLRSTLMHQQASPSQPPQTSHEASIHPLLLWRPGTHSKMKIADQLLVPPSPFFFAALSYLCLSYHKVVGPAGLNFPSTEAQSR